MTGVSEDPTLTPEEKQLSLTTTKRGDTFVIHSEVASVTRYMIEHPAIEITDTRTADGDVVAATGRCPRGLVDLKAKPRQSNRFGRIVSSGTLRDQNGDTNPEPIET